MNGVPIGTINILEHRALIKCRVPGAGCRVPDADSELNRSVISYSTFLVHCSAVHFIGPGNQGQIR